MRKLLKRFLKWLKWKLTKTTKEEERVLRELEKFEMFAEENKVIGKVMVKEFSIGLEYAENGVIVRQEYEDGAPLVELLGDDYKELIDKLGNILWAELEDVYSSKIDITVKIEEV